MARQRCRVILIRVFHQGFFDFGFAGGFVVGSFRHLATLARLAYAGRSFVGRDRSVLIYAQCHLWPANSGVSQLCFS